MSARVEQLKKAVERACLCKAHHLSSDRVIEELKGKVVWEGVVETFNLQGHDRAERCYAFTFAGADGVPAIKTMMHFPPVDSPRAAVKAAIVEEMRRK